VEHLRVPALVIHGEADRVVPFQNGRLLAQRLNGAQWLPLPGAGHVPYLEQPEHLADIVGAFLRSARARAA
jgi:pimeloyl-ACP methyl ester carboxylesterase